MPSDIPPNNLKPTMSSTKLTSALQSNLFAATDHVVELDIE